MLMRYKATWRPASAASSAFFPVHITARVAVRGKRDGYSCRGHQADYEHGEERCNQSDSGVIGDLTAGGMPARQADGADNRTRYRGQCDHWLLSSTWLG